MNPLKRVAELESQLRQANQRNEELEGIVSDQNIELLELKDKIYDLEHEVVWPELEQV